jgi:uncharacterized protein YeaO (DUF488 family)
MLRTKSVYSKIDRRRDGLRILATRVRGRGLRASRYDAWMANLGPSEQLLSQFRAGRIRWSVFKQRYVAELFSKSEVDRGNQNIKNHGQKFTLRLIKRLSEGNRVTLLCHCEEDEPQCHRHLLRALIMSKRI